ncbi:MAG: apolipoprotein N-acyltransferase [Planctomycetota bacterium]
MRDIERKDILLCVVGFLTSGVLLTLIQLPVSWSFLAWVSLVPFVLVCSPAAKVRRLVILSYLVSSCFWLGNLYWMGPVTFSGWIAFCLYTALLWPLLAVSVRYCRIKKVPLFIAVPVLFVGAERLQGLFLGGFLWHHLSHSQYSNIALIQIADIFGAAGVSFLVGMVNGVAAELLIAAREKRLARVGNLAKVAIVYAAFVASFVYGLWRINESAQYAEVGPVVGSVQSNVAQSAKESYQASEEIFEGLLRQSRDCSEAGAELVVWPETMVQATLSEELLRLLDSSHSYRKFDARLKEHAKEGVYLLVGSHSGEPQIKDDFSISVSPRYNSAFLYLPVGEQAKEQYCKIHLVPFGEVVPFKERAPWLHKFLMKFTPYDYDYTLDAGSEYTVFEMVGSGGRESGEYQFGVMICYEDTVPAIARRFLRTKEGGKGVDFLVNISNDGWFVDFEDGKVSASTELGQHTAICVFRAVENRVAIVRSVNTGISCLINTVGQIKGEFSAGTLPREAMLRKGVEGWFVSRVPIDTRRTIFSRYGQWLDFLCSGAFFLVIIVPLLARFIRNKRYTKTVEQCARQESKPETDAGV